MLYIDALLVCYRVFRKNCVFFCFFTTHCNPPKPKYHCKIPLKFLTQCVCTVTPIVWQFSVQPIAVQCKRGRGGKFWKFLKKNHNFSWTPCTIYIIDLSVLCKLILTQKRKQRFYRYSFQYCNFTKSFQNIWM